MGGARTAEKEKGGTGKWKERTGMGGVRGGDVVRWVAGIIGVAVSLQSMVVSSPSSSPLPLPYSPSPPTYPTVRLHPPRDLVPRLPRHRRPMAFIVLAPHDVDDDDAEESVGCGVDGRVYRDGGVSAVEGRSEGGFGGYVRFIFYLSSSFLLVFHLALTIR